MMTIHSTTVIEEGAWKIKQLQDDHGEWYVLVHEYGDDERFSVPFEEVRASGGLINLNYHQERSGTIAGALSGLNKPDGHDIPKPIIEQLMAIGPW